MDYPPSLTASSDDDDPVSNPQQRRPRALVSQLLKDAYQKCSVVVRTCLQPGFKRDLASWATVIVIGTTIMITFFYLLIFIWQPQAQYARGAHNFMSEQPVSVIDGLKRWQEDFSRSVIPIMCHSHNDYWRPYPLFSALAAGCTGVEADVWLNDDGTDLLVGHDPVALQPNQTLRSLYLEPLLAILERENPKEHWGNHTVYDRAGGVFPTQPNTTLTLLIDVKTEPLKTWDLVEAQLEPLRSKQFLTRYEHVYPKPGFVERQDMWPGPVTVVGSGNMDRDAYLDYLFKGEKVEVDGYERPIHFEYHDTFYDAPLGILPKGNTFSEGNSPTLGHWTSSSQIYTASDAYYASTSFKQTIGSVRMGFSKKQLANLRLQIWTAKKSGLKARYWDLPSWPINYRDYVWDVLTREGVGMLSVDDLESAATRGWSQGYIRSVVWMILVSVWLFVTSVALLWIVWRMMKKRMDLVSREQRAIFLQ